MRTESSRYWSEWRLEFRRCLDIVAEHYGFTPEERTLAMTAANADRKCALACYRAIANSLRPEGRSRYGKGLDTPP